MNTTQTRRTVMTRVSDIKAQAPHLPTGTGRVDVKHKDDGSTVVSIELGGADQATDMRDILAAALFELAANLRFSTPEPAGTR